MAFDEGGRSEHGSRWRAIRARSRKFVNGPGWCIVNLEMMGHRRPLVIEVKTRGRWHGPETDVEDALRGDRPPGTSGTDHFTVDEAGGVGRNEGG